MKKIFALLLAFVLLFSMTACGDKKETPDAADASAEDVAAEDISEDSTAADADQQTEPDIELPSFSFTQYGNAKITVVGAEFTQDDWGEDVLRIYYDYTNTGDSAIDQYPGVALDFKSITQDGQECNQVYFGINDECAIPEDLQYDCPVQPGLTSRQTMLIECDPDGGIVEVSCYIMIGNWMYEEDSVECLTFQIDPKNLMGAPEPLVMPAVTNPTYTAGLPTSGTSDYPVKCEMSIDGWELTKGDEGEDVLRVNLTVTNNDEEAQMPMSITNGVEAYQDGLGLLWFCSWDLAESTAEDDAYEEDLYPGDTVQCNALFLLRNDHPVEVVIEGRESELRLGTICDVKGEMEAIQSAKDAEQQAMLAANSEAIKAAVGVWDRTDGLEDHLTINADGTGIHDMTGDEYPFSFTLEDGLFCMNYDDGDYAEYYLDVQGDDMTLTDDFDNVQTFVRSDVSGVTEVVVEPVEEEEPSANEPETVGNLAELLIGTWVSEKDGETYSFDKDGTGYQIYEGATYDYKYEVDDDYMWIYYGDDSSDDFYFSIDGDTLTIAENWTYVRQ